MRITSGSRLLFIGDSVTDCGRARPVGSGSREALGQGYVAEVDAAWAASGGDFGIQVTNMGVSGNTVRDLARRWDADVLGRGPDWLSVMIGINDVWRQFDGKDAAASVMPDEFGRTYAQLVERTRARLKGLVLMSPYYVQADRADPMRRRMEEYTAIVRDLAGRLGAIFVDVQAALDAALEGSGFASIAADRIHPTAQGHQILARAFLEAVA